MAETMSGRMQHLAESNTDAATDGEGGAGPVAIIEQSLRDLDAAISAIRRERRAATLAVSAGSCRGYPAKAERRIAALKRRRRELEDRLVRARASQATANSTTKGAADRRAGG
ncbi:MAG: hypothetical protein KJO38_02940 [Gammaproteobacteria bacterium]|nr:hypothetical protein [Gammaproteobacteria bacterium]